MSRLSHLKLALFGDPVEHSLSPPIHRAFGAALGIEVDYRPIRVAAGDLKAALADFYAQGGDGANVTLPHKAAAGDFCRRLLTSARRAGGVNTLIRGDRGWTGANTDGVGLCRDLRRRLSGGLSRRRVLMLGAGGAAAGVIPALLAAGVGSLGIVNRTLDRAADLAARFPGQVRALAADDAGGEAFAAEVLINATSAGHKGSLPDSLKMLPANAALSGCILAYDLSYGDAARPFLGWAGERNIAACDGLGMLVEQAAAAFRLWSGRRPDAAPVLAALRVRILQD